MRITCSKYICQFGEKKKKKAPIFYEENESFYRRIRKKKRKKNEFEPPAGMIWNIKKQK
jgi:hypothetical protein